jgi:hypothetical protein
LIIISCQFFIWLTKFPKPSSIRWYTIYRCMGSLTRAKQRWWMFDAIPRRNDVAWSNNSMLAHVVHVVMIFAIVSCKWARAQSMGVDEPSGTLTLSKQIFSSMFVSPLMLTMLTSSTRSWLQFSSLDAQSSNYKYAKLTNMYFKPSWWVP